MPEDKAEGLKNHWNCDAITERENRIARKPKSINLEPGGLNFVDKREPDPINPSWLNPRAVHDPVNNPSHYTFGKFEVIDVINDWALAFNLGNAVKYIARAGKKDPKKHIEDLEKARFYLDYEIKKIKEINAKLETLSAGKE